MKIHEERVHFSPPWFSSLLLLRWFSPESDSSCRELSSSFALSMCLSTARTTTKSRLSSMMKLQTCLALNNNISVPLFNYLNKTLKIINSRICPFELLLSWFCLLISFRASSWSNSIRKKYFFTLLVPFFSFFYTFLFFNIFINQTCLFTCFNNLPYKSILNMI